MAATLPAHPGMIPQRRPWWRGLLRLAILAGVTYLGVIIVFLFLENALLFHPIRASEDWLPPPSREVQDVEFRTAEGDRIHGWWWPVPGAQGALLYAHGNAGNLSHRGDALAPLVQSLGVSVLIFDYPGYGRSSGRPSESSCYAAGDAAYDWLTQRQQVPPGNLLLYGKSLGGGVMTELASRRPHRALILVKTFTSIPDMATQLYPWLPARWMVRSRFDSLEKIGRCTRPVFIAHGDCDDLIPCSHGERLSAAANEPKQFLLLPGCGHNDLLNPDFFPVLRQFLDRYAPLRDPQPASVN